MIRGRIKLSNGLRVVRQSRVVRTETRRLETRKLESGQIKVGTQVLNRGELNEKMRHTMQFDYNGHRSKLHKKIDVRPAGLSYMRLHCAHCRPKVQNRAL